ncbi:MAG TPA: hypothetical protein VMQ58_03055 [Candidatus Saccharimonadales bacterium]|jgi:beta-lactamase regulating signal transducer with metallopeptidase domain|nr:hypothetical protein [Candidatus Saccharimonadales bacterium]
MIKKLSRHKLMLSIIAIIVVAFVIFGAYQVRLLQKAHSTFDNYYDFRGCVQLLKKTSTYGICRIKSGDTIKIVLYHGKWYLNGDLPITLWGHLV